MNESSRHDADELAHWRHYFGDDPSVTDEEMAAIEDLGRVPYEDFSAGDALEAYRLGRAHGGRQLASALNVALAWHDGRAQGTEDERTAELEGCRIVLDDWQAGFAGTGEAVE